MRKREDYKTNLSFLREKRGLTQSNLSALAGVNIRTLQGYEQGLKDINKAQGITLYKLAQALGCKVEDLLELKKEVEE